ncbi:MAG: cytochrome c oxidase subunit 3 [Chloroflexi bacterium]|nr:cytochrome c oxidase subunit 3 [Chloroflexota bacterium]
MTDKNKLGMIFFILSEAVFFIMLILAYVYFHYFPPSITSGPTAASSLDPGRTFIFSLFLFSSSFTVWRAEKSQVQGSLQRMRFWLIITILFGVIFLFGQSLEWSHLFSQGTGISTNQFGTTFFTLTGFHGVHVTIGLIMLAIVLGLALRGHYSEPGSVGVTVISWYWHFVDAVWVIIFTIVYLLLLIR